MHYSPLLTFICVTVNHKDGRRKTDTTIVKLIKENFSLFVYTGCLLLKSGFKRSVLDTEVSKRGIWQANRQCSRSSTNKVVITTGGYKNLLQQRQGFKIDHKNFVKQRHDCRFLGQRKEPFLIKVTGRA